MKIQKNNQEKMSVHLNVHMSKIMHTPIKVGVCMQHMPIVEPCILKEKEGILKTNEGQGISLRYFQACKHFRFVPVFKWSKTTI